MLGLGRPAAAAGANLLAQQPGGLAATQLARALRPRARISDQDRRSSRGSRPAGPTRTPNCWSVPSSTRNAPRCQWWEHCLPQLDPDDVSLRIDKAPLDMREIATLRRHGITTITDLVDAELDQLLEWYLPEVSHRGGAEGRIRVAARRARMLLEGISFDRETVGPIEIPQAEVEIDLDIESSADGRVYLWGFLVQYAGDERRRLSRVQPVR